MTHPSRKGRREEFSELPASGLLRSDVLSLIHSPTMTSGQATVLRASVGSTEARPQYARGSTPIGPLVALDS
jgi:hypothetical protein